VRTSTPHPLEALLWHAYVSECVRRTGWEHMEGGGPSAERHAKAADDRAKAVRELLVRAGFAEPALADARRFLQDSLPQLLARPELVDELLVRKWSPSAVVDVGDSIAMRSIHVGRPSDPPREVPPVETPELRKLLDEAARTRSSVTHPAEAKAMQRRLLDAHSATPPAGVLRTHDFPGEDPRSKERHR
jgi:hypothetical protein